MRFEPCKVYTTFCNVRITVPFRGSWLLEGITDPERVARIGDLIIECEKGAELLERARED